MTLSIEQGKLQTVGRHRSHVGELPVLNSGRLDSAACLIEMLALLSCFPSFLIRYPIEVEGGILYSFVEG